MIGANADTKTEKWQWQQLELQDTAPASDACSFISVIDADTDTN
jgi:hypothetical protein